MSMRLKVAFRHFCMGKAMGKRRSHGNYPAFCAAVNPPTRRALQVRAEPASPAVEIRLADRVLP